MSGPSGWVLRLQVPRPAAPAFEAALASLGGALASGAPGEPGPCALELYLPGPPAREDIVAVLAAAAAVTGAALPDFTLEPLPDTDWVAESQRALPPLDVGRFHIHGSHAPGRAPAGRIPILIDAGAAFGTGRHETTRGCLLALSRLAARRRFARPLDLGCGSGLLAVAMARLWRARVLAADNDPVAVRVAAANARANRAGRLVRCVRSEGFLNAELERRAPFDLIVANILAAPLVALAGPMARHLAPGGTAILSGLLTAQEQAVLAPHRAQGLCLAGRLRLGEWSVLVLGRPKPTRRPLPGCRRVRRDGGH